MTANTKMTEYWKKVLEILPVDLYGTMWAERRNSLHILLKETYQAGRTEMAEEIMSKAEFGSVGLDEIEKLIAQRDGGKK